MKKFDVKWYDFYVKSVQMALKHAAETRDSAELISSMEDVNDFINFSQHIRTHSSTDVSLLLNAAIAAMKAITETTPTLFNQSESKPVEQHNKPVADSSVAPVERAAVITPLAMVAPGGKLRLPDAAGKFVDMDAAAPQTSTVKVAAPVGLAGGTAPQIPAPPVVPVAPPVVPVAPPVAPVAPPVAPAAPPRHTQAQIPTPPIPTTVKTLASKDFWACDNPKCGSDDLTFILGIMVTKQATESSYVDYVCNVCKEKHGALLTREEINRLDALPNFPAKQEILAHVPIPASLTVESLPPATRIPVGPENAGEIAAPAAKPKRTRKAPAVGMGKAGAGKPETFRADTTPEDIQKIVAEAIKTPEQEIAEDTLLSHVRPQIDSWELPKLIKEWEGMTGKTYEQGKTVPATMAEDIARQIAGLPAKAESAK